jgi:2'-5' RNA ligase
MPAAQTCRLFLALWPGAATRRTLLAERDRWAWPAHARPTAAGDLHLTLHFIGPVPAEQVSALVPALAVAAPRFTLHPGSHAQWGEQVAVLEPAPPPAGLMWLHGQLAQALRAQGLPVQIRAFRPHVTLARTHGRVQPPPGDAAAWRWPVASYVLAQSVPGRPYRVLARYRLGAATRGHGAQAAQAAHAAR